MELSLQQQRSRLRQASAAQQAMSEEHSHSSMVSTVCQIKVYTLQAHLKLLQLLQGIEHHRSFRILFAHMNTCVWKQAMRSARIDVRSKNTGT